MDFKRGISAVIIILLLCFCHQARCQNQGGWDRALDRYELLCERCIELLEQKRSGEDVPQESLSSLLTQLSLLRSSLNEADKQMSPAQKMRFEMIRRRFETARSGNPAHAVPEGSRGAASSSVPANVAKAKSPSAEDTVRKSGKDVPAGPVSVAARPANSGYPAIPSIPDVFRRALVPVSASGKLQGRVSPEVFSAAEYPSLPASPKRTSVLAAIQAGVFPTFSLGGFAAFCKGRCGFYLKGRTDLAPGAPDHSFSLNSDGTIDGGGEIWSYDEESRKRMAVTAGAVIRTGPVSVYAGAGYGSYRRFVKSAGGQWGLVNDLSAGGLTLDLGIMADLGDRFFAGAGACVTGFGYSELEITLGIRLQGNH